MRGSSFFVILIAMLKLSLQLNKVGLFLDICSIYESRCIKCDLLLSYVKIDIS